MRSSSEQGEVVIPGTEASRRLSRFGAVTFIPLVSISQFTIVSRRSHFLPAHLSVVVESGLADYSRVLLGISFVRQDVRTQVV